MIFEEKFLNHHGLVYNKEALKHLKENTKTCIWLLYIVQVRSWKDLMVNYIRKKLKMVISVTAPKEIRGSNKNYCREPNTFFIGTIENGKTQWKEVSKCVVLHM